MVAPTTVPLTRRDDAFYDLKPKIAGAIRPHATWLLGLLLLPLLTSSALAATDFSDFSGFGSASSTTVSTIKIGALTDSEVSITANSTATGDDITGTDDEDGVTLPASVQIGQTRSMTVNVTNSSGATVFLNVWIDFNRNGDLTDAGEQVASNVLISTGTSNSNRTINFTVPMAAALGDAGVRVRLTSSSTPGSVGLVGNGEVEDHLLRIAPTTDFGDLSGFPIAGALADTNLRLGALVDTEIVPQLDVNAMGDDLDYTDDEDGVTVPTAVIRSDASNLVATVTNTTGATAYLNAWIDFNGNGVLTDNGEQVATNILVANGSSNSVRNLPFTVPDDAALGAVGVRVRLSSGSSPGSNTITGIGEVEDYVMTIIPPTTDFGDFAGFATASSTASATLKIGATVDTEFTADLDTTATGDDLDGTDDEDGVTLPSAIMRGQAGTMTVNISNTTGSTAFLNVWIDFNGNGVLTDAGEQVASNITLANNSVNSDRTINFTVPANALVGTVGVRTRVTSTSNPGSTGASGIGEVEDNTLVIASTADFGDYLGFASASSSLSTNLKIGALTDAELSANTDTSATGDDNDGVDDEDGVTLNPVLERGAASSLIVNVSNTLGSTAFINVWIDWNKNGVMTDAGEQIASNITVANNSINSNRLFNFTVPAGAALGTVGVRVRLTSTSSPGSVGNAGFGEVEDYIISVVTPGSSPPQTLVQQFFVPMPESQIKQSFDVLANSTGSIIDSVISIVAPVSGSRIIYDHWEDGYEADLSTPVQSTTRIWGDGSNANGIAPGFTNDPFGLPAGTVIAQRNLVPLPRTSAQLYDARDRVGATQPIAMSRSAWATTPGALMADAVEVPSTAEYGTNFLMPVGENVVFPTPSSQSMFEFCSMFVMAADSGTQVQIDKDANGSFETSVTLAQGESYLVNGGVLAGARVTSTKAVQVQLFTGDINANFESRWYTIPPTADWATQYYSPVGTAANGQQTYIWLHNPDPAAITVNFLTKSSSGSFSIPAKSTYMYLMPMNSGARFTSVGSKTFFPIATVGASPTANAAYDWGFSLVPGQTLTTELVVGWGPGSDDGTANGNPVWVTAVAPTTIYVDYNGDRLGPLTDTIGGKYDVALTVGALDVSRIFEPDKDQTGLRLYTLDGTLITGAWGQDPATAGPARPFIDAGTTIPAFPMPVLSKTAAIFTDNAAAGLSVSDVMEFTVTVSNRGVASLSSITAFDSPPAGLSYVANSTKRDGVSVADSGSTPFPLDEGGQTVALLLPKASTVFKYRMTITTAGELKNVASLNIPGVRAVNTLDVPVTLTNDCAIQFTNSTGTKVNYQTGDGIYVTMTDADANTSSTTKQTVTVMMQNTSNGDVESLVLTETGNNTGVFRNLTGLPSSKTLGGSDEDGTLLALLGHTLSIVYTDPVFGGPPCSDTASFVIPSLVKQLYLSDPNQALDRRDPVATGDITMARTTVVGAATTGGTLDLNAIKDAYIKLKNSTQNFGATNKMVVDRETNDRQRALLEFDVSSIPSNATIVSAVLSLKCIRSGGTMNVNVHEVLQAWSEGTLSGTNGVVNWNQRQSGVTWTTAGGTYNSTAAATLSNPGTGTHSWNIPTLVQGWVNGSKVNNGLLIDSPDGGRDRTVEYSSLQDSTAANWPSLLVSYTIPVSTTTVTWTQAPAFASTFTMPAGTAPVVTAYYSVESGVMPASPAITATLKKGIATVATSNGTTAAGGTLTFTFPNFGSAVNLIAGDVLSLVIVNSQSGVTYTLDYDSTSVPAKISLPTSTVISVDSVGVYDAPYPGGSPVSTVENGQTRYVRAVVSDPFGDYDITSLPLSIDGPGTLNDIALTLTDANMVDRTLAAKTYEYVWETGVTPGNYTVSATAKEGFENTITDEKSTVVRLSQTDVGSPSSTRFTTGDNGPIALEYEPGQPIYVRVTDIDQNENPNVVETVTVSLLGSGGDTEVVTLTETGANTGVFTGGCPVSTVIPGTSGNGTLYVPPSSVASVTYVDQDDARDTSSATVPVTEGTDYGDHLYYSGSSASQKASADLYIGTNATDGELSDPSDANANKDDNAGRNDEDLTIPTFTIGTTTDLVIPVTIPLLSKLSGSKAQIDVWVDWNGDGLIDDIDEAESPQIISTAGTTNVTFSLTPAPSATVGTKYLRIRVTEGLIDPDFDGPSTLKGEVEDYAVSIITGTGTDFGDCSKFSSASSKAVATLRIGALLDAESSATTNNSATGDDITGSADEEGVSLPSSAAPGATHSLTVNVNNTSGATAFLNAWIDFNNNGSLTDSGEQIATNVTVASGTVTSNRTLNFTVPGTAFVGNVGVRVRLTSTSSPGATGLSGNGEVEDYIMPIAANSDFGDHAALGSASSAYSASLRMGAAVDVEASAITNANATGDDLNGIDDEDGVTLPFSMQQGTAQTMTVNLTNTTGATAFLNAWIDYNNNGVLTDAGEQIAANVAIATGTNGANQLVNFTVPMASVPGDLPLRVRLTTTSTASSTGASGLGEVEDYVAVIACPAVTVAPSSVPAGLVGSAYSQTVTASGGVSPHTFVLSNGSLPTGLTLNGATGALSGTPSASGLFSFTLRATGSGAVVSTPSSPVASPPYNLTHTDAVTGTNPFFRGGQWHWRVTAGADVHASDVYERPTAQTYAQYPEGYATGGAEYFGNLDITEGLSALDGKYAYFGMRLYSRNKVTADGTQTVEGMNYQYGLRLSTAADSGGGLLIVSDQPESKNGTTWAGNSLFVYRDTNNDLNINGNGYESVIASDGKIGGSGAVIAFSRLSPSDNKLVEFAIDYAALGFTRAQMEALGRVVFEANKGTKAPGNYLWNREYTGSQAGSPNGGSGGLSEFGTNGLGNVYELDTLNGAPPVLSGMACSGTRDYSLRICPIVSLQAITTTPTVGTAYTTSIAASGGATPYVFGLASGSLPEGLGLNTSTGVISGVVTSATAASFTVSAVDANGCPGTRAYTLTPVCPAVTVTTASLPNGTVGSAYSQTLAASGGTAPHSFAITSGALPAGLSLNSGTGEIIGTPTSAAAATFTVAAADIYGCAGTRAYTVTPACPVVVVDQTTLPAGTVGTVYSQTLTASGGIAPYSFAITSGTLPSGLSLSTAGILSGTPTAGNGAGTSITVRATDNAGCPGSRVYTLKVCPVVSLSPTTLTNPTIGSPYSATVTASGGATPYIYSIASGSLPTGLSLNSSTGEISGTATSSTAATFSVSVVDANSCTGTRSYTLTPGCPTVTVSPSTVPAGAVGTAYSQTMSASGGLSPYSYAVTAGTLPAGLSLNSSTGEISGTPTAGNGAGTSITVRATGTAGCQGTRVLNLQICPVVTLSPTTLTPPTIGTAYSTTVTPAGGASPYVLSLASGSLPTGLTFNTSTGVISGTATNTTAGNFTVRAVDANSCAGTQAYTLTPACPTITLTPTTLSAGTVGTAVSQTLTATGGTAPRTFAKTAGTLPTGITLSSGGVLSGTPTAAGTYNFTVGVTDTYGCTGSQAYSWVFNCPTIAITPASLSNGMQYAAYSTTLSASNGTAPYAWTVSAGTLPTGLTLSSGGVLSGTITGAPGTYNFTARAADTYNCAATKAYALVVTCNVITIAPTTLPKAYYNTAYSQTFTATQGTAPYTWTVIAGAPPPGITLSTAGVLSGSSIVYGDANFTVRATDVNGCTNTQVLTLTVKGLSLGNLVYDDANYNGVRDPGEPGVPDVTVQLWHPGADHRVGGSGADADVQIGASITTDADGLYQFADKAPGWYFVRVIPPVGLPYRGALPVNLDNGIDNDNNAALQPDGRGTVITGPVIRLDEGVEPTDEDDDADTDFTVDFGLFAGLRVGNFVWSDTNDNGLHEVGEAGLDGVLLEIWHTGADGQVGGGDDDRLATTTTAGGGIYSFADLPPEALYVRIPAPPAGHPLASSVTNQGGADDDNDGYQISAGAVYSGVIDMAAIAAAGNYANNTVDFGFIPVAAPSVYLSASQADGVHVFNGSTGLFNGTLNHPFGTGLSQGNADGNDVPHDMELGPDGNWYVAHPAVGNLRKIAANGTDLGVALDNVTAGISAIQHFAIGPDRNFYVVDATGDRVVRFHGPFSSTPGAPLGTAPYTFISQAGIADLNFGPDGNLYVLVQDGATSEIRRHDATTGALMNVVVTTAQVAGAVGGGDTSPQVTGFDIYDSVLYGVNNTDGEVFSVNLANPSAPGLPQVIATIASAGKGTVEMRDIEFNPASSELFIAGFQWGKPVGGAVYASGALVRVDVAGAPNATVSVFEDPIPAPPGPNDETWSGPRDLAIGRPYAPLPETVAIGSLVWHDEDADGQQGAGEAGIGGVRVELWRDANNNVADGAETRIGWTFTDANGHYYFSGQAPGLYQVKIPASNFGAGMPLAGTGYSSPLSSTVDDQIDGDDSGRQFGGFKAAVVSPLITLTPGAEPLGDGVSGAENARGGELDNYTVDANGDMTVDFGFVEPGIMGIGNLVYTDANANNLFDSGEGTDGVVVELYRWGRTPGVDDPVASTVTTDGGLFLFSSLWQGQYFIHLPAPQFVSGANLNGLFSLPGFSIGDDDTGEDSLDAVEPWVTGVSSGLINLVRDEAPADTDTETGHDLASDLDDLNINLTIDIGLFRAVEVGNLVFEDYNSNGTYDAGEGRNGVLLELYTDTQSPGVDTPLAVTTTNANGLYRFRFLRPGSYIVHIPVSQFEPGGALYQRTSIYEGLTGDDDVGEDGINNGDALDNGVSSGVVHLLVGLTPTDESGETGADAASDNKIDASVDLTVDFGFQIPVGVGNLVYVDSNDNGRADAGEGVDGVYVELYRSDQTPGTSFPIFTRITAGGGKYFFDALAEGDYVLHIPASQFDPGRPLFGMESSPGASSVAAALDDDVTGNENGLDDYLPFVNGISTAVFTLAVDVSPTAATGETGMFADIDDSDDNNYNLTIDFGFKAVDPDAVGVGNLVFLDLNGNGAHDEGEGVNGVQVQLFAAAADPLIAAPLATLTTSDGGYYFFRNLAAGDYQVFIPPSEFAPGKPLFGWSSIPGDGGDFGIDDNQDENGIDVVDPATTGVASSAFNLTPGEEPTNSLGEFGANAYMDDLNDANADLTIDFGFTHPVAVGNLVFIDANANGHADLGEGVEGVTLELYTEGMWPLFEAPVATTVTVADGSYRFDNLSPDHYFVRISPSQFGFGMPLFGQASMLGVQLGDDDTGEDGIDDGQASYNGIQSSVFELSLSGSPTGSQESGYLGSSDDAADAAIDLTIDFGFVSQIAVGNLVFHDINNDGVFDPNTEYGVDGVTVELWSSDPGATLPVGSTSTFGGGSYRFDVAPGSYYIRIPASNFGVFGVLANRSPSQATIAGDDDVGQDAYIDGTLLSNGARTAVFTLVRDSTPTDADTETGYLSYEDDFDDANSDLTVDLGFTANPLSVGNLVFRDLNVNGVYDASDYGIPDVPVRLYNVGDDPTSPSSVPVMVTTTASDGSFLLTTYLEGTYFMHIPPSAFAAFAPLDSHVSTPSFGADDGADDDAGEDGIDAAEPAVTGINSTSFDLIYGTEPIDEATETGFQAASDNGNDADTDLTIDFGFVLGSGSPSGSSMRRNLSDGNTTNTTASAPSTFAAWQTQNSMAGLNNPNDDPDADGLTNLMEYALGSAADNALGVSRFRLERNATTGAIDALLTRPAGEHNDLRYTIELGSDLVAWSALNRTPTVQNGADQTVTLRYADVAAAFNGAAQGFLRLKVTLDADLDGVAEASAVTRAQGWAQPTFQAGRQSLSMPLLRAAIFTGKVSALNGSTATLSNTGGSDIRTYLQTGVSYYAEVLDGALAGRTFDLDSTNSSGSTIRLTTSASTALIGARISLRPHHTLGGLLPVADMQPALDQNDADRVMFFDTAQNNFQIYWLHAGTDTAQWVRDGDTTLADASARIIPPLDGMLVQLRSTPVTFTFLGEVRTVALVLPQTAGTHLIGTSLATPQTPGAQPFTSGSRLRLWSGDADPASTTYQNYLLNPQSQWIDEATGTNVTTQPLLDACRAFFLVKP